MEKRFKRGLVLGKFMPPHLGHLYLINTAAEQCEKLFVMICSLKSEPINGALRYNWLRMIYENNTNIEIIHVEDENPQKPQECESTDVFYNEFWVPTVYNRIKLLNVVFTSEEYGDEFAKYLSVKHVLVDIDRNTYPVSGTKIRNNPFEYWDFIPDVVKPYYTKRVVIMGPESTGKSMLTERLAKHYKSDFVGEYGRTYCDEIKPTNKLENDDFYKIAVRHDDMIVEKHAFTTNKLLFIDTECITTKLFGELYINGFEDDRLEEIIESQYFDLYLLMDIDVPWVNDGTRDFPHRRKEHMSMLKKELESRNIKYILIQGDYEQRFENARKAIETGINS